ncbi:MAG: hypothetical protein R2698_09705 [Microthrixaceae bacterium]
MADDITTVQVGRTPRRVHSTTDHEPESELRPAPWAWIAGAAALGAGAVHAAAIGAHAEHRAVVVTFAVLAIAQLAWGATAFARPSAVLARLGVVLHGAALVGWVLAKTRGVALIDGLDQAEPVQWADALCAALVTVAAAACAWRLLGARLTAPHDEGAAVGVRLASRRTLAAMHSLPMVLVAAIALLSGTAMVSASTHSHAGSHEGSVTGTHSHGEGEAADDTGAQGSAAGGHHHTASALAPKPYDPDSGVVDLGGVPGVTAQQQARAESLVRRTIEDLPQFADWTTLDARGYHSIADAMTGYEHYVNWQSINDGRELDPEHPESIVFQVDRSTGTKRLVAAMYMAEGNKTLDEVPDIGGKLTQWHIHDDLCYTTSDPPRVAGLKVNGRCADGLRDFGVNVPMIHVWIVKNPCGPFSALDGIGAGQVKAGETKACDSAHGA